MTDLTEDNPRDSRATITRSLELHRQFWEQMIQEFDKPEGESRVRAVTYASLGTLHTAVALEWVAREFGRDKADELSEVFYRYAADGEDYEGLFEGRVSVTDLKLEIREQQNETIHAGGGIFTPAVNEDYWAYRVRLSDEQAIVGFPKILTIGIGFAVETDWNTNLPYTCGAERIYEHIECNKGDDAISREDCLTAIRMIQEQARKDEGEQPWAL